MMAYMSAYKSYAGLCESERKGS